jgi:hypothetical protein
MRLFAVLALVLPLAACGGGSAPASGGGGGKDADLEVTVWPGGRDGPSSSHRIRCPGDGRCDRLAALPARVFEPVPGDLMCTQIYGGPDVAEIRGTLDGRRIDARFKRTDGCEIARWNQVAFLLSA